MRIRKSRCVKLDRTHYCIGKFNIVLSLCGVLEITLYFSESFLKAAAKVLAVAEAPRPLGVTVVCFLGQESNLWSFTLQQRHKLFSKHFLYLLLVNLPLLASLEKRSTYGELDCFLEVENNVLEGKKLIEEATRNMFVLFWNTIVLLAKKTLPYF